MGTTRSIRDPEILPDNPKPHIGLSGDVHGRSLASLATERSLRHVRSKVVVPGSTF